MSKKTNKQPRKPSLGVNFEHGMDGGVVAYTGNEEILLALLPPDVPVTVKEVNALAIAYKKIGKSLNTAQSLRVLKDLKKNLKLDHKPELV